jgi:hypothetical protein
VGHFARIPRYSFVGRDIRSAVLYHSSNAVQLPTPDRNSRIHVPIEGKFCEQSLVGSKNAGIQQDADWAVFAMNRVDDGVMLLLETPAVFQIHVF